MITMLEKIVSKPASVQTAKRATEMWRVGVYFNELVTSNYQDLANRVKNPNKLP